MSGVFMVMLIVQNFSIALGVGASTLAIVNFFIAIKDGTINPEERKMMGLVYVVLRIAMSFVLLTSLYFVLYGLTVDGLMAYNPSVIALWILLFVLYNNALLMTLSVMPSSFGPSIQVATWYSLSILLFVSGPLIALSFTVTQFIVYYITFVVFATTLINIIIQVMKEHQPAVATTDFNPMRNTSNTTRASVEE